MRKRQLTTSSFRICFHIEKKIKKKFEKIAETKIPVSSLGQIQVRSTTFHPLPRNLGGVCGYLPGKSRPYFYAQSTALDLLCQDLSSDPKNIYFYFIKYCIKVKNLGISSNFQSYFFVGLDQSHTRVWPKNMLTRRISLYRQNPQKRNKKKITIGPAIADFMQNQTLFRIHIFGGNYLNGGILRILCVGRILVSNSALSQFPVLLNISKTISIFKQN